MKLYQLLIVAFALCVAAPAAAEELTLAAATTEKIESITVTAEKREEDPQEIPQSISVLSEIDLEDARVDSIKSLSNLIPNLHFYDWGGNSHNFIYMRGIGAIHNEPAIGFYVDGVSYFESGMFNYPLFDLERIEVLRGPQGTLYGRNTIGGVINIITKKPGNELTGTIKAGMGDYGLMEGMGSVSGPLIKDKLFLGLSGFAQTRDGFQENTAANFSGDEGDYREGKGARLNLLYTPTSDLDISFSIDGQDHDDGAYPVRRLEPWQAVNFAADDYLTYSHNYKQDTSESSLWGSSLSINWDSPIGKISSVTAYRYWDTLEINDQDFSILDVTHYNNYLKNKQFSQELRLSSPDGPSPLKWLAGLYGFHREKTSRGTQYFDSQAALFSMTAGSATRSTSEDTDQGVAFFGEATYTIMGCVDLTAGLRYDSEKNEHNPSSGMYAPGAGWAVADGQEQDSTSDALLPKVSIAWRTTDSLMLYSTVARGYRSGGYNNIAPTSGQIRFEPEYSWNYEVGLKSKWLDDTMLINLALFYITIDDQQLSFVLPTGSSNTYVDNSGSSNSKGVEVEMLYKPVRGLELSANFAYNDAVFDDYTDPVSGVDYADNTLPLAPEYTFNLAAQYRVPLGRRIDLFGASHQISLFARADLIGVGKIYWEADNDYSQSDYEVVNLRVGLESDYLDLHFWMNNLLDTEYQEVAFKRSVFPWLGQDGEPRTFGVTLTARF